MPTGARGCSQHLRMLQAASTCPRSDPASTDKRLAFPDEIGEDGTVADLATTRQQDAVRLLVLLHVCGTRPAPEPPRADAVAAIFAESRIQALDFWLRNPDYLALELIELHASELDPSLVSAAELLVDERERHFPTMRHFFGAYTELDGALNLLRCYGLAWDVRRPSSARRRRDVYLLQAGEDLLLTKLGSHPELAWYVDRAQLVNRIAGDRRGRALKDHQKRLETYRDIRWGERIEPVRDLVLQHLEALRGVQT